MTYENSCEGDHDDDDDNHDNENYDLDLSYSFDPSKTCLGFSFFVVASDWLLLKKMMMMTAKISLKWFILPSIIEGGPRTNKKNYSGTTRTTTPTSIPWSSPLFPPPIQSCSSPGINTWEVLHTTWSSILTIFLQIRYYYPITFLPRY